MDSIPDQRRAHTPQSIWAHVPQLLSLCSRAQEPQLLSPHTPEPTLHSKRSHCNEKSMHRQLDSSLSSLQLEKSLHSNEDPAQPKVDKQK